MTYQLQCDSRFGLCALRENEIVFTAEQDAEAALFSMEIDFDAWNDDCFILMPACAYNGNRFPKFKDEYPPMYTPETAGMARTGLITDVPALHPDGSGKIEVTAGDMAVPCVGVFDRQNKKSFFLFTGQEVKGKNIGFTVESGKFTLSYPANREYHYRMCRLEKLDIDTGISVKKGEQITSPYKIYTDACADMAEFYAQFFKLRKSLLGDKHAEFLYTKALWDIMEKHFNDYNFSGEYYAEMSKIWQCGWAGGGMSTYPLLKYGTALSKARAVQTIDYYTEKQAPTGFYYGYIKEGVSKDDSFDKGGLRDIHMVRKSADLLYFFFKNITATEPKNKWLAGARKCADAYVKLFERYGNFGQFVNIETGDMVVDGTFAGAIAPAALAKSYEYFGEEKYLTTAKDALDYYFDLFMQMGMTTGGPGEILAAPDSESAFGLLESCIAVYEADGADKWLSYAETIANYCSSWVVSYAYKFPEGSEFNRLGINAVGSVFANVQNKHSSPGICTLSGDSILKLYRYTKKEEYLEFIKDIAYFIPQCLSTEARPIYSWSYEPKQLTEGFICERVNMSDWESPHCVGGVFNHSCWPETSLILSFVELMTQEEML